MYVYIYIWVRIDKGNEELQLSYALQAEVKHAVALTKPLYKAEVRIDKGDEELQLLKNFYMCQVLSLLALLVQKYLLHLFY